MPTLSVLSPCTGPLNSSSAQVPKHGVGSQSPLRGQHDHEAAGERMADSAILRQLATYVLPQGNSEYRWRISVAMALLIASKGLNVVVSLQSS